MYRGVNSPLAGVAAINAICFGVYGNVNRRLANPESLSSVTIAGMASGFVQVKLKLGIIWIKYRKKHTVC